MSEQEFSLVFGGLLFAGIAGWFFLALRRRLCGRARVQKARHQTAPRHQNKVLIFLMRAKGFFFQLGKTQGAR